MAIPALSRQVPADPEHALRSLHRGKFESSQERDWLIEVISGSTSIEAKDLIWMLFKPDRVLRAAGTSMLRARPNEDLVELFVRRCRKSASTVIRGATACLFAIEPEGLADTLDRLLSSEDEADAEAVRRIAMEAPPSSSLEPLYWTLVADGSPQQR